MSGLEAFLEQQRERRQRLAAELRDLLGSRTTFTLEVGCGHGHWLTAYAETHPDQFCLGIDLISKRVRKATTKRDKRSLPNLHFFKAEAFDFMAALPEEITLDSVFVLFPDPWPKKRHHKNRLVQEPFLSAIARHCRDGSRLYFRTDHDDYFEWATDHVSAHPAWQILRDAPWVFEHRTVFQDLLPRFQSLVAERRPVKTGSTEGDPQQQENLRDQ